MRHGVVLSRLFLSLKNHHPLYSRLTLDDMASSGNARYFRVQTFSHASWHVGNYNVKLALSGPLIWV